MGQTACYEEALVSAATGETVAWAAWDGGSGCHLEIPNKADEALLTAAPDLLAALKAMTRAFSPHPREDTEGWREEHEAFEDALAAIAKASPVLPLGDLGEGL